MRLFLLVFFLLSAPFLMAQITQNQFERKLDELVYREHRIEFNRTCGVIVGIIEGDSTYVFSYGSIRKDTIILPQSSHVFQLGSLTNVLTATQYWDLQQAGHFQLDAPIHHYLPPKYHNIDTTITFRHLLSHTSGLPLLPDDLAKNQTVDNQPFANYTADDVLHFYKNYDFATRPKSYTFSHIGYALLGLLMPPPIPTNNKVNTWAQGYDKSGKATLPWQKNGFQAAIGGSASLEELLPFLRQQINNPIYLPLRQEQAPTGIRKNTAVGLGWHIIKRKGKKPPIIVHTGATNGYRAYMAFEPTMRRGVIVLSNSEYGLHGLGYTVLVGN